MRPVAQEPLRDRGNGGDPSDPGPAPIAAFFVAVLLSGSPSLVGAPSSTSPLPRPPHRLAFHRPIFAPLIAPAPIAVPLPRAPAHPSLVGASLFSTNSKNFPLLLDCIQYTEYNVRHRNERK